MLTGKMVRVRYARDRLIPYYLDTQNEEWRLLAEQLLEMFRAHNGRTRGELEEELEQIIGDDPSQLVHQGLAKLLEDRCEFEVVAGQPPDQIRAALFRAAAWQRQHGEKVSFDRAALVEKAALELGLSVETIERGLFADLKTEQRMIEFKDISVDHLLERYNVSLAQAILLRATRMHVTIRNEPPNRYRQLLRALKFHRLLCEFERIGEDSYTLHIDGPLSLFSSTQKYGLQLALFLPVVLLCKSYEVKADILWGAQKKPKTLQITPKDKLVSHALNSGMYVPPEMQVFVDAFRKRITDWELIEETEVYPLGSAFWVPDYRLVHKSTGEVVLLEVMGFWRKASAEKHLLHLRRYANEKFLLAVSDQLHIEETLGDLMAGIHRFRHMPLPDEIAKLAKALISS